MKLTMREMKILHRGVQWLKGHEPDTFTRCVMCHAEITGWIEITRIGSFVVTELTGFGLTLIRNNLRDRGYDVTKPQIMPAEHLELHPLL